MLRSVLNLPFQIETSDAIQLRKTHTHTHKVNFVFCLLLTVLGNKLGK